MEDQSEIIMQAHAKWYFYSSISQSSLKKKGGRAVKEHQYSSIIELHH